MNVHSILSEVFYGKQHKIAEVFCKVKSCSLDLVFRRLYFLVDFVPSAVVNRNKDCLKSISDNR